MSLQLCMILLSLDVKEGQTLEFPMSVSQLAAGVPIELDECSGGGIHKYNRVHGLFEDDPVAFFRLTKFLLNTLALGDFKLQGGDHVENLCRVRWAEIPGIFVSGLHHEACPEYIVNAA